jgi:hypothetical protein
MLYGDCIVCGASDARALVRVELPGGASAILCGSHALMRDRGWSSCRTVEELRVALKDRRLSDRRALGEGDELAERLSAAFTRDRRGGDRRLSSE